MARILIVGAGPHGLITFERIAAHILNVASSNTIPELEIEIVDRVDDAAGQVYKRNQSDLLLMNTVAGQITSFSGVGSPENAFPGHGPKLTEWAEWEGIAIDDTDYISRCLYGRYMQYVQNAVRRSLKSVASVSITRREAKSIDPEGDQYRVSFSDSKAQLFDYVVLATGHANQVTPTWLYPLEEAAKRSDLTFIPGSDLLKGLPRIEPETKVGIIGTGLSFYDVLILLTEGYGGQFKENSGKTTYVPSGKEPIIFAGSRSGVPSPARGVNQKPPNYSWKPKLFTVANVRRFSHPGKLQFNSDILPWISAEVELKYHLTFLNNANMRDEATKLSREAESWFPSSDTLISDMAHNLGSPDWKFRPESLARPFKDKYFSSPESFTSKVKEYFRKDLEEAEIGNVDSPIKAALDVLRDTRYVLRELIDYGGLTPDSQKNEFLSTFQPWASFLAAGPPLFRVQQMFALLESGILNLIGPETLFSFEERMCSYRLRSKKVNSSEVDVNVLIDARVPTPSLRSDKSSLIRSAINNGLITAFTNSMEGYFYNTDAININSRTQQVINRNGASEEGVYAIGIPTENVRWFTTVGSTKPNQWSEFVTDSDNIARSIVEKIIERSSNAS